MSVLCLNPYHHHHQIRRHRYVHLYHHQNQPAPPPPPHKEWETEKEKEMREVTLGLQVRGWWVMLSKPVMTELVRSKAPVTYSSSGGESHPRERNSSSGGENHSKF
ncbi:hypothetical protein HanIR_Chr13g0641961 [Helianthus annuus]|nr:hypothetical protein HanIR_Chr13g0641961 [Helianthus annuus]